MIKWHEVTWYSRLLALVLFLGIVPMLSFYIGIQYEILIATTSIPNASGTAGALSTTAGDSGESLVVEFATTTAHGIPVVVTIDKCTQVDFSSCLGHPGEGFDYAAQSKGLISVENRIVGTNGEMRFGVFVTSKDAARSVSVYDVYIDPNDPNIVTAPTSSQESATHWWDGYPSSSAYDEAEKEFRNRILNGSLLDVNPTVLPISWQ